MLYWRRIWFYTMFYNLSLETGPCGFVSFFCTSVLQRRLLWASGDSNPGVCPSFFQGGWSWIFKKKQKGGIPKKLPLRYGTHRAIRTPDPFGPTPPPHARGGTTPLVSISDGDLGSPSPPLLSFRMHCPSILRGCSSDVSYNAPSSWRNGHGGGRTLHSLFPLPRHS